MRAWPAPSAAASVLLAPAPGPTTTVEPEPATETPTPQWRPKAGLAASLVGRFAALAWCWAIIWLTVWSVVPASVGWTPTVVTSGSMEPTLPVGSVVHIDGSIDLNTIGVGSIIAFEDPAIPGLRVTHRITGVEDEGGVVSGFRTKGDANESADSTVVPVENVYGVARLLVPYAGLPKAWVENGQTIVLTAFMMITIVASVLAFDTIQQFVSGRPRKRRPKAVVAVGIAVAAMLGAPSSSAAFSDTTSGPTDTIGMTNQWFLDTIDRNTPIAHWRLGEAPAGPPVGVLTDTFETFTGYNTYGSGNFVSSTAQARSGVRSGLKTGNNDPNGGWKLLPSTVTGSFTMEIWVYRPTGFLGGSIDRVGLEDAAFNGYSFRVDHNGNTLGIDRRTAGLPATIGSTVAFNPPEDTWYRLELVKSGSSLTVNAYNGGGTILASTSATDSTTNSFDRVVVHGGWDYYVDDLRVAQTFPATAAADRIGTLDGSYAGTPTLGVPGLVNGQPDTAVDLDGASDSVLLGDSPDINTSTRAERTTELWFEADSVAGRQILYEEGGTVNGLNVYLDGATLYATAWGDTLGWSNDLVVSTAIAVDTRYHVAVTLDAVTTRRLVLYVDGSPVGTATKADSAQWNAHSDDGAIGVLNGGTRFHDGNSSGTGNFPFDGTIDEVVLFNSIVPAADIANHHAAGI